VSTYSRLILAFRTLRQIAPPSFVILTLAIALVASSTIAARAAEPTPAPPPPPPDTVVLANGDHLSGSVTQIDGGKLTLHTEYAGDIVIDFTKVASVKLQKAEVLSQMKIQGKKIDISKIEVVGIENQGKEVSVTTQAGATQTVPAPPTVRTPAAQTAYEKTLQPNWLHGWITTANLSFAIARGNSNTTTLGTGDTLVRPTLHDKTSLYYNEIFTHDNIAGDTTANNIGAGARYDHNLTKKIFAFGTGDFFEDQLQELDLRSIIGGGGGWHAIAKPNRQLDVLTGLVWTHEKYSQIISTTTTGTTTTTVNGVTTTTTTSTTVDTPPTINNYIALDLGETFTQKLGKSSIFSEQAYVFPDLNDAGQYNANATINLSTKIKSFLSWQTTASDVYVSNPPAGTKTNDFILTTGFGFSFTRK